MARCRRSRAIRSRDCGLRSKLKMAVKSRSTTRTCNPVGSPWHSLAPCGALLVQAARRPGMNPDLAIVDPAAHGSMVREAVLLTKQRKGKQYYLVRPGLILSPGTPRNGFPGNPLLPPKDMVQFPEYWRSKPVWRSN